MSQSKKIENTSKAVACGQYPVFLLTARFFLGAVFFYSGWSKLIAPAENFAAVIGEYQVLPSVLAMPLAIVFPWFEIIFGVFTVAGFMTRLSVSVISLFLGTFITLLGRSIVLKLPIAECGCFGAGLALTPVQAITIDSGLLILALAIVINPTNKFSLDERLSQ
jgi:uncharacterized membrane protein YphA (DoxX/SURF4 family)